MTHSKRGLVWNRAQRSRQTQPIAKEGRTHTQAQKRAPSTHIHLAYHILGAGACDTAANEPLHCAALDNPCHLAHQAKPAEKGNRSANV